MSQPPNGPPAERGPPKFSSSPIRSQSPTYDAIMRFSVENPLLSPENIAILLQRDKRQVMHIMGSDAFLEERARLIMEAYGHKIVGIRGKILDTAADAVEAIRRRIADPRSDVAPETLLKAFDYLMRFVATPVGQSADAPQVQNNVTVNLSQQEVERVRELRNAHIRTLEVAPTQPQPVKPAALQAPEPQSRPTLRGESL